MSKRTRISVQGATLPRMDRNDIWVAGYHAPMVSAFAADIEINDENTPVYGYDATIDTRVLNTGTLTLTSYDHPDKTAAIMDVLQGYDPMYTGLRAYKAKGSFTTDVVRLTKHPTADAYIMAEFFGGWNPVLRPKQGDPKASGTRALDGRCGIPLEFRVHDESSDYVSIVFDVADMTVDGSTDFTQGTLSSQSGSGALTANPDGIGPLSSRVGLSVEIQKRDTPGGSYPNGQLLKSARVAVADGMVTTAGVVKIYKADIQGTNFSALADITHVHVYALKTGSQDGSVQLLGDGIDVRGRFDATS